VKKNNLKHNKSLIEKYPPSGPCSCKICRAYCNRPGRWTIEEASKAIKAGLSGRMMLEISPEYNFGVLLPAFKGNEGNYALDIFSGNKCTFLQDDFVRIIWHSLPTSRM
jgi:hypothetical protein